MNHCGGSSIQPLLRYLRQRHLGGQKNEWLPWGAQCVHRAVTDSRTHSGREWGILDGSLGSDDQYSSNGPSCTFHHPSTEGRACASSPSGKLLLETQFVTKRRSQRSYQLGTAALRYGRRCCIEPRNTWCDRPQNSDIDSGGKHILVVLTMSSKFFISVK